MNKYNPLLNGSAKSWDMQRKPQIFGIDDAILWPMLIGAASGGLTSKDPLKGALVGGGLGAAGGGLLGGSAAGAQTAGGTMFGVNPATAGLGVNPATAGVGFNAGGFLNSVSPAVEASQGLLGAPLSQAAPVIEKGTQAGLLDKANYSLGNPMSPGGLLDKANEFSKPIGTAMNAASMFQPPPKEEMPLIQPPPMPQPMQSGQQGLSQLAGQNQQMDFMRQQEDMKKRAEQKARIARIGGFNYG